MSTRGTTPASGFSVSPVFRPKQHSGCSGISVTTGSRDNQTRATLLDSSPRWVRANRNIEGGKTSFGFVNLVKWVSSYGLAERVFCPCGATLSRNKVPLLSARLPVISGSIRFATLVVVLPCGASPSSCVLGIHRKCNNPSPESRICVYQRHMVCVGFVGCVPSCVCVAVTSKSRFMVHCFLSSRQLFWWA